MPVLTLAPDNHAQLRAALSDGRWCVACLCAAWCDVCGNFRDSFGALAALHPDMQFVWIDIEDEADLVGDVDVENFPTLLIQHGSRVAFFGTVEPGVKPIQRLIQAQVRQAGGADSAVQLATATPIDGPDLRARLDAHLNRS